MFRRLTFSLGVFLAIFGPVLNLGLPFYTDVMAIFFLLQVLWYLRRAALQNIVVVKEVRVLAAILAVTSVYGLFNSLFLSSQIGVMLAALRPIRALITMFGIYAFLDAYVREYRENFAEHLLRDTYIAIGLHGAIMVAQFAYPQFRDWIYPYTFAVQGTQWNQEFRMAGLTNGGGAMISIFEAVGVVLFPFVAAKSKTWSLALDVFIAVILLTAVVLSGRSGLYEMILFTPISYVLARKYVSRQSVFTVKGVLQTMVALALGTVLFLNSFSLIAKYLGPRYAEVYSVAFGRTFSGIAGDYDPTGTGARDTVEILATDHMRIPDNPQQFLFGDAVIMEYDRRGVDSDIGYVRVLFGYGVIGSLIQYMFYVIGIMYAYRARKSCPLLAYPAMLAMMVVLVFQAKEVAVLTRIGLSENLLLLLGTFYYHYYYRKPESTPVRPEVWGYAGRAVQPA